MRSNMKKSSMVRNTLGGEIPPGWGGHPKEAEMWSQTPVYRIHPITMKEEAVGGLFHRFYPEHVEMLQQMHSDGWPHADILEVAKELYQRQQEEQEDKDHVEDTTRDAKQESQAKEIRSFFGLDEEDEEDKDGEQKQEIVQEDEEDEEGGEEVEETEEEEFGFRRSLPIVHTQFLRKAANKFLLPVLPYSYSALEPVIDAETMRLHHMEHFGGYVKKLNEALVGSGIEGTNIQEILSRIFTKVGIASKAAAIRDNGGGYANHDLYFKTLAPGGSKTPVGELAKKIKEDFGSWSALKKELVDSATSRFGSGWTWLALTPEDKLVVYSTINQDSPLMWGDIPLLGIDVWEHAYYKKYGPKRKDYVTALLGIFNWDIIEQLYLNTQDPVFKALQKAEGERTLSPKELRHRYKQSFTRKTPGVSMSAASDVEGKDKKKEEEEEEDELA